MDLSGNGGHVATETLYHSIKIKGFYGNKVAISQGYYILIHEYSSFVVFSDNEVTYQSIESHHKVTIKLETSHQVTNPVI